MWLEQSSCCIQRLSEACRGCVQLPAASAGLKRTAQAIFWWKMELTFKLLQLAFWGPQRPQAVTHRASAGPRKTPRRNQNKVLVTPGRCVVGPFMGLEPTDGQIHRSEIYGSHGPHSTHMQAEFLKIYKLPAQEENNVSCLALKPELKQWTLGYLPAHPPISIENSIACMLRENYNKLASAVSHLESEIRYH